jgi:hypothetical protein
MIIFAAEDARLESFVGSSLGREK